MESIYAALLLHKADKKITEANLEKILTAAGVKVDKDQIAKLIAGLKVTNIDEIIKSASVTPVITAPAGKTKEQKKEKKKKEKEEEEGEPTGNFLTRIPCITGIGSLF